MEIDAPQTPACFLIVHNVSKRRNIGTLIRSAVAFGVRELCLVGSQKYNAFGSHGTTDYLPITHFTSLKTCCEYLRGQQLCEIIGLEIDDSAQAVDEEPFTGPTAFMVGNEGTGLSKEQRQECQRFVYIRQFGAGTASLNVTVACSIVLHRFCSWAQYQEREHQGGKFKVEERPFRRTPRGVATSTDLIVKDSESGDGYVTDWSNSSSGYFSSLWS